MTRRTLPNTAAPKSGREFRLGTTSYIYPGSLLYNVERLAPAVDDIELILFDAGEQNNLPDAAEIKQLDMLAERHNLTYTVHLPLDVLLGHSDEGARARSVTLARKVIGITAPLRPFAIIVHLEQRSFCSDTPACITRWQDQCARSLAELTPAVDRPDMLSIETLGYPFSQAEALVNEFRVSICLDIGHVWHYHQNAALYCRRYLPLTRVIHLHGTDGVEDHRALPLPPDAALQTFLAELQRVSFRGAVSLEIFSESDLTQSLQALEQAGLTVNRCAPHAGAGPHTRPGSQPFCKGTLS